MSKIAFCGTSVPSARKICTLALPVAMMIVEGINDAKSTIEKKAKDAVCRERVLVESFSRRVVGSGLARMRSIMYKRQRMAINVVRRTITLDGTRTAV